MWETIKDFLVLIRLKWLNNSKCNKCMLDQLEWEWTPWWEECHKAVLAKCNSVSNHISQDNLHRHLNNRFLSMVPSKLGNNSSRKLEPWQPKEEINKVLQLRPSNSIISSSNKFCSGNNSNTSSKCRLSNNSRINRKALQLKHNQVVAILKPNLAQSLKKGEEEIKINSKALLMEVEECKIKEDRVIKGLIPTQLQGSQWYLNKIWCKEFLLMVIKPMGSRITTLLIRWCLKTHNWHSKWWGKWQVSKSLVQSQINRKLAEISKELKVLSQIW